MKKVSAHSSPRRHIQQAVCLGSKTDPGPLVQAYAYDSISNRTILVDPDGGIFTTSFDPLNRTSVTVGTEGRVYTAQYDADSRNTTLLSGNSSQTLRAFDPVGRVITLIEATAAGSPVLTIVDSYDPGNRKTSSAMNGVVTTYSNDAENRLLGQTVAGGVATFSYDPLDNTLLKWYQGQYPQTMTYNVASQQVTMVLGAATTNYTYNQAGAETSESASGAVTGYVYDCENRLLKTTTPAFAVTTYSYGGDGLRRSYQKPGQPINTLVWDGANYLGEI